MMKYKIKEQTLSLESEQYGSGDIAGAFPYRRTKAPAFFFVGTEHEQFPSIGLWLFAVSSGLCITFIAVSR